MSAALCCVTVPIEARAIMSLMLFRKPLILYPVSTVSPVPVYPCSRALLATDHPPPRIRSRQASSTAASASDST
jgi:hypothetical protein